MKKILIVFFTLLLISKSTIAQPVVTDTLQWLQTHIEGQNSYFSGKQFHVIMDSLYGLKAKLAEYNNPVNITPSWEAPRGTKFTNKDSLFIDQITIYFKPINDGGLVYQQHENNFWNNVNNHTNNTINTHVPYIRISFAQSVPFLRAWCRTPLGDQKWTALTEGFFRTCIVQTVSVGEY